MEALHIKERIKEIVVAFVKLTEDATAHRLEEVRAAIQIQCAWRRKLVHLKLGRWNQAATDIQRLYRGHLGRVTFLYKQVEAAREIRMAFFNRKVTYIQKIYRGYTSRKYIHSYYDRKEFILKSTDMGKNVKKDAENYHLALWQEEQDKASQIVREKIRRFWIKSHHLLSTKSRNSIFYSPYIAVLKRINNLEDQIRETWREEWQKELMLGTGSSKSKSRGKAKTWVVPVSQFITTQGSYGPTAFEKRRAGEKAAALLDLGEHRFRACVKAPSHGYEAGTRTETEWGRKQKLRSLEQQKSQMLYLRVASKPFFITPPKSRRFSCGPAPPLGS